MKTDNINSLKLVDKIKFRLVYSFYISDKIKSFYDHISYPIHFICLEYCLNFNLFDEVIFIIQTSDKNNYLSNELKNKLIELTLKIKNVNIIFENDNKYEREGGVFKNYIIDKLYEYDGLTLFFHNKGLNPIYGDNINNWCSYWIIGEYFYLMTFKKEYLSNFLSNNKLIYGWPYMYDNYHPQWLIGGNCFWMKCQDIYKYIKDNNLQTNYISSKCISEFYFPEIFDKELIDYPNSNIIKNYTDQTYYEPGINETFKKYLERITPYDNYIKFINFYNYIINVYNSIKN